MSELIKQEPPAVCYRLAVSDADALAVPARELACMLELIYLVREFETALLDLKDADLVHGPVHASIGQEAVAAGVALALRRSDLIASTHRAHGHFLSKALAYYGPPDYDPREHAFSAKMQWVVNRTMAEIMGLRDGWCGGRGGSMHLYDAESGNLGSNAIVGGGIPIATGVAMAERLQHRDKLVVSFFGDGAFNQGCFHEVANMASLWRVPILYLVENNLYAVGTCTTQSSCVEDLAARGIAYGFDSIIVDGMDPVSVYVAVRDAAERMRVEPYPLLIEAKTYRYVHHGGGLPGHAFGYRTRDEEAEWRAKDPVTVFPQQLVRLGIMSEEQTSALHERATQVVAQAVRSYTETHEGVRVVPAAKWPDTETVTENVRCEDPTLFEGVTFVEREDFAEFRPMTFVQAIAGVTLRAMQRDERVLVLGEDVANLRGGVYGATKGIDEVYPNRLINTPISETGFIGIGGGLAAAGMRPVVEVMYPDFALMAGDQLFNQIGKLRHMYGGQVRFPIILRTRAGIGFGYGGQHSMDPSGLFGLFSGWRIVAPSNSFDYIGLFNTAMRFEDPVLIVEHGMLYGEQDQVPVDNLDYFVAYGKARVLRPGTDVTVLTYMRGVKMCLEAAEAMANEEGLSAEVIDLRTVDYVGMDWETIGASLRKTGSLLIVEQAPRSMSVSGRIGDEVQARFFDYLDCPVGKVTGLDVPPPVSRKLEAAALPSLAQVRAQMLRGARHAF
ncbi:MAG: MFS transporter [Anaerolineales bacterium]|nr:MFS transporter [Anaerolineales bacterium]